MNVTCPECQSVFRVDPAKVPASGVRARCSVCGGIIAIAGGSLAATMTPSGQPAYAGAAGARAPAAAAHAAPYTVPSTAAAGPTPSSVHAPPYAPDRSLASTPAFAPASTPPVIPAAASAATVTPASPSPGALPQSGGGPGDAAPSDTPRRAINPFLNADPQQRARRLARALVSDLVAYHPQKREEGLRNGTLRQLFRDEIKKSYEEFIEQVGRDVADGSTHFQDALNDILASGNKLF